MKQVEYIIGNKKIMEQDFIYWRHRTPVGIKVEEISGGARFTSMSTWLEMARQVYCENGRDGYRSLEHYDNGAPYLEGEQTRISITHCPGLLAVATLPKTPEADLRLFTLRTAMGIDAERRDRRKVLDVRERFLSAEELDLVPADDLVAHISAWTAKEALYKAALTPGLDWRQDIILLSLPQPMTVTKGADGPPRFHFATGQARLVIEGVSHDMELFCYDSDDFRITLAYSPKCAKFMKNV